MDRSIRRAGKHETQNKKKRKRPHAHMHRATKHGKHTLPHKRVFIHADIVLRRVTARRNGSLQKRSKMLGRQWPAISMACERTSYKYILLLPPILIFYEKSPKYSLSQYAGLSNFYCHNPEIMCWTIRFILHNCVKPGQHSHDFDAINFEL